MSVSQGCYVSAMGSLDWLDTSYSPMQLIEKYKLPTLVRIGEGYYSKTNTNCFSAMDVIKLHEIQRVDMIVAKLGTETGNKDPDAPEPTRLCFPKSFSGRFDLTHQAGDRIDKTTKSFKTVRKMAELVPHYVKVVKRPCKKGEAVEKGDVLEILGLTMCSGWWEDHGFLKCRKQDGDEALLNLKWRGVYETIPDPEGYTIQDILQRFMMPCKVSLRSPGSHLPEGSELITLLPQLGDTLTLEREITNEFLVGTTVDLGSFTAQNPVIEAERPTEPPTVKSSRQQSVVVLSKNANVLFQICQDMVHKRAIYLSLLEIFGDYRMDKIPLEHFICEYAVPFVTFTRTDQIPPSTLQLGEASSRMTARQHSRSTPDLTMGRTDDKANEQILYPAEGKIDHNYADPEKERLIMTKRALPPLPYEFEADGIAAWQNRTVTGKSSSSSQLNVPMRALPIQARECGKNFSEENKTTESYPTTAPKNDNNEDDESDSGPYTNALDPRVFVAREKLIKMAVPLDYRTNRKTSSSKPPAALHPDPPPGFMSSPRYVEKVESSLPEGDKTSCVVSDSSDAPPIRQPPPPPPPRTTPMREVPGADPVYRNLELVSPDTSSSPPMPESSPPVTPARKPPMPQRRRASPNARVVRRGSHSFNTIIGLPCPTVNRPNTRHLSPCRLEHARTKQSFDVPLSDRPSSVGPGGYLKPLRVLENPGSTASSRSHSTRTLMEKVDFSDLSANEASKAVSASAPSRPITTCKPTRRISTVRHIPSDIGKLSTSELAQCLRLLKLDEEIITRFRDYQINGALLVQLTSQTVRNELALTDFEAEKVDAFRRGWRPDGEI